jgi:hypothetical protein
MNAAKKEMFESVRAAVGGRIRDEGQIRDLAWRIAEFATDVRRRAERAVGYSRAGLLLEAVAEAEAEPDVEEASAELITAEMRSWRAFCAKNKLPVPDTIPDELVAEIQESKEKLRPLRSRLAKMRRLVLSDAGMWERLEVLRQLHRRDPDSPAWTDDLAALEPHAADELGDRFEACLRAGHLDDAETCVARLSDGAWTWSGAARVAAQLRARLDERQAGEFVAQAHAAADRLDAERVAENMHGARHELDGLRELEQRLLACGGELPGDLVGRIDAVESWLAEREDAAAAIQANRESVDALAALAVEDTSTLTQLRAAMRTAEQTVEGVPDDVRGMAERRIGELEGRVRRRRLALVAVVVLAVAGGIVATVLSIQRTAHANRVQTIADAAMQQVREDRLTEAEGALREAEADPTVAGHAEIIKVRTELASRREAIADRHRRFETLLAEAGDPASESAKPERIQQITEQQLVQDAAEQGKVVAWQRAHARAGEERLQARKDAAMKRAKAINLEVSSAEPDASPAWDGKYAAWESALGDVERQDGTFPEVQAEVARGRTYLAAQRNKTAAARTMAEQSRRLDSIAPQSGQPARLADALEAFVAAHPEAPQSADFRQAAAALPGWDALLAAQAIQPVPNAALATAPQRNRDEVRTGLDRYSSQHAAGPYADAVAQLLPLLAPATQWRTNLLDKLKSSADFELFTVDRKDGARFYLKSNPNRVAPQAGTGKRFLMVLKNSDGDEALLEVTQDKIRSEGDSPQRKLRSQLRELLDTPEAAGNDVQGALAALRAIVGAKDMDPVFHCGLLQAALEYMSPEMPPVLKERMEAAAARLKRELPDGIDWRDEAYQRTRGSPGEMDDELRKRPAKITAAIAQAMDLDAWQKAYAAAVAAAAKPFETMWEPAGVMLREGSTPVFAAAPGVQPGEGAAIAAVEPAAAGGGAAKVVTIGLAGKDGKVLFQPAAMTFPQGTMLFMPKRGGRP